jgi:hypothetical protein
LEIHDDQSNLKKLVGITKEDQEGKELAKMMMSKKDKKLYDKVFSKLIMRFNMVRCAKVMLLRCCERNAMGLLVVVIRVGRIKGIYFITLVFVLSMGEFWLKQIVKRYALIGGENHKTFQLAKGNFILK